MAHSRGGCIALYVDAVIKLPIVIGMHLEISSPIGFTMYIEAGECFARSVANWLLSLVHFSQENVRCMMGYIVNLMVILDDISRTASGSVKGDAALRVIDNHISSDHRDRIHLYIRSFVAETFSTRFATPEKDLALENIVNLIRSYCAPHNS